METFLKELLREHNISESKIVEYTLLKLVQNAKINELAKSINLTKKQVIDIFHIYNEKEAFKDSSLILPNGSVRKEYIYHFDLEQFPNIVIKEVRNLDKIGLEYDALTSKIFGEPSIGHTIDLQVVFQSRAEENGVEDIKIVSFTVNADPKDLWLNKPSNKSDLFAKEDSHVHAGTFLDKRIVIASLRGRSHAHEGSFRDDDFYCAKLTHEWEVISIADGAGSAKFARQGSKLATIYVCESFSDMEVMGELTTLCGNYFAETPLLSTSTDDHLKIKSSIFNILYKVVRGVHTHLSEFAQQEEMPLKDLHTTLIFALARKFDFGYVLLTFGVGDCPINVVIGDCEKVNLLNVLDVGEFGGGTRFITMPEIFSNVGMGTRFAINRFDDFSKLLLMTDGIYDPKFVTENKLEDLTTWRLFLQDLDGKNEDGIKVDFNNNDQVANELLSWMNFWSKGNHDDRTLAIIY